MAVYVVKQKTGEKELAAKGQKQVAALVPQRKGKKKWVKRINATCVCNTFHIEKITFTSTLRSHTHNINKNEIDHENTNLMTVFFGFALQKI